MGLQVIVDGTPVGVDVKQIERGLFEVSGTYQGIKVIVDDTDYQTAIEKWLQAAIKASGQEIFKK